MSIFFNLSHVGLSRKQPTRVERTIQGLESFDAAISFGDQTCFIDIFSSENCVNWNANANRPWNWLILRTRYQVISSEYKKSEDYKNSWSFRFSTGSGESVDLPIDSSFPLSKYPQLLFWYTPNLVTNPFILWSAVARDFKIKGMAANYAISSLTECFCFIANGLFDLLIQSTNDSSFKNFELRFVL